MSRFTRILHWGPISIVGAALIAHMASVSASHELRDIRHAANNGIDSAECGSKRSPCRSISQALANASHGDLIVVGPGRYGDLNNDGALGGPGEERGGPGCNCVLLIDKRVSLRSEEGATATVLDAKNIFSGVSGFVVRIVVDDVALGRAGHGFTIKGSGAAGGVSLGAVRNVTVAGNVFNDNPGGVSIPSGGRDNIIVNNFAVGSGGSAFDINGSGNLVWRNTAINNGDGFTIQGEKNLVIGNVATGNIAGFSILGGSAHEVVGNSAFGNTDAGVRIFPSATASIHRNNIFGNGDQTLNISAPALNCGILNQSGQEISATRNFWGVRSGPGPDPADQVCDVAGSRTLTEPVAEVPFTVPNQWSLF